MEFYPRTFKDSSETFIPDKLVKSDSRETGEEESHRNSRFDLLFTRGSSICWKHRLDLIRSNELSG